MGSECHHADGAHPGLKGHALSHALGAAETRCVATQERLTAPRRRVLELLLEADGSRVLELGQMEESVIPVFDGPAPRPGSARRQ